VSYANLLGEIETLSHNATASKSFSPGAFAGSVLLNSGLPLLSPGPVFVHSSGLSQDVLDLSIQIPRSLMPLSKSWAKAIRFSDPVFGKNHALISPHAAANRGRSASNSCPGLQCALRGRSI
jgi:hypothetical protein